MAFPAVAPSDFFDLSSCRLRSLWELMQKFRVDAALRLAAIFEQVHRLEAADETIIPPDIRAMFRNLALSDGFELGFVAFSASLRRLIESMDGDVSNYGDMRRICREMQGRLADEIEARCVLLLSSREATYYEKPRNGWEASLSRFPDISDDVEEAYKCFALSRFPASVFHSIQIIETTLIELGRFLGVSDPLSGWTAVSKKLNSIVQKSYKDRSEFERENFAFLEQLQGTVEALKNAWRNKISHSHERLALVRTDVNFEVAEEVLFASRAFVRRLAEGLPARRDGNDI
jgi:hypothetical protein